MLTEQEIGVQGKIEIRRLRWINAEKPGWCHADHGEGTVVDRYLLPRRGCRITESLLREGIAEHNDRRSADAIVIVDHQTTRGRNQPQPAKVVAGNVLGAGRFGLTLQL